MGSSLAKAMLACLCMHFPPSSWSFRLTPAADFIEHAFLPSSCLLKPAFFLTPPQPVQVSAAFCTLGRKEETKHFHLQNFSAEEKDTRGIEYKVYLFSFCSIWRKWKIKKERLEVSWRFKKKTWSKLRIEKYFRYASFVAFFILKYFEVNHLIVLHDYSGHTGLSFQSIWATIPGNRGVKGPYRSPVGFLHWLTSFVSLLPFHEVP